MQVELEFNAKDLELRIDNFRSRISNLTPLMREISETMKYAVDENFATHGHGKWQQTLRGGKILQDTGRLRNSISTFYNRRSAVVGTNVVYAAIHNFGGRTSPHTIEPKNKKALAFGGGFYKKVNHPGSLIPARPFLTLEQTALEDIKESINNFINRD